MNPFQDFYTPLFKSDFCDGYFWTFQLSAHLAEFKCRELVGWNILILWITLHTNWSGTLVQVLFFSQNLGQEVFYHPFEYEKFNLRKYDRHWDFQDLIKLPADQIGDNRSYLEALSNWLPRSFYKISAKITHSVTKTYMEISIFIPNFYLQREIHSYWLLRKRFYFFSFEILKTFED